MTTKHTVTLTCDICKSESDNAYSWARIDISGSSEAFTLMPDRHYDICHNYWMKHFHTMIHRRQPAAA